MKTIPENMETALKAGVTTHCYGWVLKRLDGVVMGFTDHDKDLVFLDPPITLIAETGLSPSALSHSGGLSTDNMDVIGFLRSMSIEEQDLASGLYDGAEITAYRIDWQNTEDLVILLKGSIGEITRGDLAFNAEIRGLAHILNQPTGRVYSSLCDALLGDENTCKWKSSGVDNILNVQSALSRTAFVATIVAGIQGTDNYYDRGLLSWTQGDNTGVNIEIKSTIDLGNGSYQFNLWEEMPYDIIEDARAKVTPGCDKTIQTCKAKFDNVINFQGFPRIPGNDAILQTVKKGVRNDGGSLF